MRKVAALRGRDAEYQVELVWWGGRFVRTRPPHAAEQGNWGNDVAARC
jgi:hypothetical protein